MDISLEVPSEYSKVPSPMPSLEIVFPETAEPNLRDSLGEKSPPKPYATDRITEVLFSSQREEELLIRKPDLDRTVVDVVSRTTEFSRSYADCLVSEVTAMKLVQKFINDSSKLKSSRAKDYGFSIPECMSRLEIENSIQFLDPPYFSQVLKYRNNPFVCPGLKAVVSVHKDGLYVLNSYAKYSIRYMDVCGILLGNESGYFKIMACQGINFKDYDCITLITELRSYCLVVTDETLRYDLYLVISWQLSNHAMKTSLIPLTKQQMSVIIVKQKVRAMAQEKLLFVNELFLLGIYKTLEQTNASAHKKNAIWKLIENIMFLPRKMFRIFKLMKPKNFMIAECFYENFMDSLRIRTLQAHMFTRLNRTTSENRLQSEKFNYMEINAANLANFNKPKKKKDEEKEEQNVEINTKFIRLMTKRFKK